MHHPDVVLAKLDTKPSEEMVKKVEDRFKEFAEAYERLGNWVKERDIALEQSVNEEMED